MKNVVDNFELLGDLLFDGPMSLDDDEFYFLQVLVRGKDGNKVSGNNKNRLVKFYRITSKEQLFDLKDEICLLCRVTNGRAYINPTPRNYKNVANLVVEDTVRTYVSQNYAGVISMYPTACGKSFVREKRRYIVDIDDVDDISDIAKYTQMIYDCGGDIKATVPTRSGYHLVCSKFNTKRFSEKFPDVVVQKNNPTLLYFEPK